jgi:hypothetical protein
MILELTKIAFLDLPAAVLCALPYPGHRRGCPNLGKKEGCPPCYPLFWDKFDLSKPVFAIVNEFDLEAHVLRMKLRHPDWSDRQLRNCLYWQPKARKCLRTMAAAFRFDHPGYAVEFTPEARGVNVTETLHEAGLDLEWPPVKVARQVAFAAIPSY